jgi:hypothetical protein
MLWKRACSNNGICEYLGFFLWCVHIGCSLHARPSSSAISGVDLHLHLPGWLTGILESPYCTIASGTQQRLKIWCTPRCTAAVRAVRTCGTHLAFLRLREIYRALGKLFLRCDFTQLAELVPPEKMFHRRKGRISHAPLSTKGAKHFSNGS